MPRNASTGTSRRSSSTSSARSITSVSRIFANYLIEAPKGDILIDTGETIPFVDPGELFRCAEASERDFDVKLAKQEAAVKQ